MEEKSCKVAAIDLGTQTFRLLAAEIDSSGPRIIASLRKNVRLGQGLLKSGKFCKSALERAQKALTDFANYLFKNKIDKINAIGTEAFRIANNREVLLDFSKALGIKIVVISPQLEADLAVKGAFLTVPNVKSPWLMLDSGGGSTEIVKCNKDKSDFWLSMPIGAVSIAEEINKKKIKKADDILYFVKSKLLQELGEKKDKFKGIKEVVATGGTATTISAVIKEVSPYDPKKIRGHRVNIDQLILLFKKLFEIPLSERKKIKGLEPERADIFPSGIAILIEIIRYLGLKEIIISDGGILLGLLVTTLEKECNIHVKPSSARSLYV